MNRHGVLCLVMICAVTIAILGSSCFAAELRGAWVSAWEPGFFTQAQCDATIAAAKKAGLNALFIEVRKSADAYYESAIEPRGEEMASGFDPLTYMTKKAHEQGMQVHAWAVIYRAWVSRRMPSDPKNVINLHPDWVSFDRDGKNRASEGIYLDPGVPGVREYIVSVLQDIVSRYDIDGIHYDYIRYPAIDWGYSPTALKRYYADTGASSKPAQDDPKWLQWRREQVTALVKLAHDRLKAAKPNIMISASTIAWGNCTADFSRSSPYAEACQDWKLWMSRGWIDVNCPMNYKTEKRTRSAQEFRNWLAGFKRWNGGRKTMVGLEAGMNSADDIIKQIEATRKYGHDGFVLFAFNQSPKRDALVERLGSALGPAPALSTVSPEAGKGDAGKDKEQPASSDNAVEANQADK